jgi:hypothetical protein
MEEHSYQVVDEFIRREINKLINQEIEKCIIGAKILSFFNSCSRNVKLNEVYTNNLRLILFLVTCDRKKLFLNGENILSKEEIDDKFYTILKNTDNGINEEYISKELNNINKEFKKDCKIENLYCYNCNKNIKCVCENQNNVIYQQRDCFEIISYPRSQIYFEDNKYTLIHICSQECFDDR